MDRRREIDHELYREYNSERHLYDFMDTYCRWYENGGQDKKRKPIWDAVKRVVDLIEKRGYSEDEIAKSAGISIPMVKRLRWGCYDSVELETAKAVLKRLEGFEETC